MGKLTKRTSIHCLTLAERIQVIQEYDKNTSVRQLASKFDCGESQIRNVLRRRDGYLEEWKHNPDPNIMRLHNSDRAVTINLIVNEWLKRCKSYPNPITDRMIKDVGFIVSRRLRISEHKPSEAWLARFKRKFNWDQPDALKTERNVATQKSLDLDEIIEELTPKLEFMKTKEREKRMTGNSESITFPFGEISDETDDERNTTSQSVGGNESVPEEEEDTNSIATYQDALNCLGQLEDFALYQENVRAIGLINQLMNIFRKEVVKTEQ